MKKTWLIALMIAGCALLTGCGSSSPAPTADLSSMGEVHAVAREEGSGTRNEFERLTGIDGEKTKKTANSTEDAIKLVASDKDAVAYVAYDSIKNPVQGVKVLQIEQIMPGDETISSGKYPLTRTYYLCWKGDLSPAAQDIVAYIKTAGQAVVGGYATPIGTPKTFLSTEESGSVRFAGSTSVAPLMKALLAKYGEKNPNVTTSVDVTDSTKGITAALRGEADIAMTSRSLKDYEDELLSKEPIARDGIAIIVNEKNPLTSLTRDQVGHLFAGSYANWKDIK